jgi:hypothetical protein
MIESRRSAGSATDRPYVMPTKKPAPLPEPLRYLQPFANTLANLPPDGLNEDVNAAPLEGALRTRIRDMDLEAAEAQLAEDRDQLEHWLEDKPDHPAHWILGFILSPTLATDLTRPLEPPPRGDPEPVPHGPKVDFVPPDGWRVKQLAPYLLQFKKGKLSGTVMAIDESLFHQTQRDREGEWVVAPGVEATRDIHVAQYGNVSGKKYVYRRIAPDPSKRVDYVLSVPGGFAMAGIEAAGADFDESVLESALPTLRLSASA